MGVSVSGCGLYVLYAIQQCHIGYTYSAYLWPGLSEPFLGAGIHMYNRVFTTALALDYRIAQNFDGGNFDAFDGFQLDSQIKPL